MPQKVGNSVRKEVKKGIQTNCVTECEDSQPFRQNYTKYQTHILTYLPALFKETAFTLAEVLITLGIIGIVAALTIPSMTAKHQEKVLVSQAKKSYSVILNAINAYNAENGAYNDYTVLMDYSKSSAEILKDLSKYFNNPYICPTRAKCNAYYKIKVANPRNDGTGKNAVEYLFDDVIRLKDGSFISLKRDATNYSCYYTYTQCDVDENGNFIMDSGGSCQSSLYESNRCGRIRIDINGPKGPNRLGSDVFTFHIMRNKLYTNDYEGNINYILLDGSLQKYTDYNIGAEYKK